MGVLCTVYVQVRLCIMCIDASLNHTKTTCAHKNKNSTSPEGEKSTFMCFTQHKTTHTKSNLLIAHHPLMLLQPTPTPPQTRDPPVYMYIYIYIIDSWIDEIRDRSAPSSISRSGITQQEGCCRAGITCQNRPTITEETYHTPKETY